MCCKCCSATQRKSWIFGLATFFVVLGIGVLLLWPDLSSEFMYKNLVLRKDSKAYANWVEAPIPIYLEFYLFNWTNPGEIRNPKVKPNFVEMGPYVFLEKHSKENVTFYPNETVSYFQRRTWFFDAERSNGTLEDLVTTAHAITATMADEMRDQNLVVKKVINFMLNHEGGKLHVTKSVREWIFDGYQDDLIDFLKHFNKTKVRMPYKRFGWLVDRNNSLEYDGLFTIQTGVGDVAHLGRLTHWNGRTESDFYEPPCSIVNGTTGDIFPPHLNPSDEITIFVTDACRFLNLQPNGTVERYGIEAVQWVGTEQTLDSGANFPNQKCFCDSKRPLDCPKAGVVECKKCRYNAPIYTSFPHFYLADESYVKAISGMHPDPDKHKLILAVEPNTGIPLEVSARLQINMMIQPDNDFDIYRGVPKVLMPMFWFQQTATLDQGLASETKLVMNLGWYGCCAGVVMICLGVILLIVGVVLTLTNRWKHEPEDDEDMLIN